MHYTFDFAFLPLLFYLLAFMFPILEKSRLLSR